MALEKVKKRNPGFDWPESTHPINGMFMDPNHALCWELPLDYSKLQISAAIRHSFEVTPSTSLLGKQALGLPLAPYDILDESDLTFTKADLSLAGKFPVK